MKIKSRFKNYDVITKSDDSFIHELCRTANAQFVIDDKVYDLYKNLFREIPVDRLYLVEATESNKIIETALDICEKITEIPAKRNTTLISFGGGIVQDITGFVANVIYRGINWIFVPTTLLASCDSCIGGKTSLNYKRYKNLLGSFYPPDKIYIYSKMFKTLTERDYKSGLGEVVKFNIMAGEKGLQNIEIYLDSLLERKTDIINYFVEASLSFKKTFIEIDEFDKNERIKLNFAHTFGHSIEVVSAYEIPHGTAVAIGMIMANSISEKRGLISHEIVERSENVLLRVIDIDSKLLEKPLAEYMKAIRKDKKQVNDALTAVLISSYGNSAELSVVHNITEAEIEYAINYFIKLYEVKYED